MCTRNWKPNSTARPEVGNLRHACHTWHAKQFLWHAEAPCFTYRFCYDSHRRHIDLDLYKNTCLAGTLKDLKPLSRHTVSKRLPIPELDQVCRPQWTLQASASQPAYVKASKDARLKALQCLTCRRSFSGLRFIAKTSPKSISASAVLRGCLFHISYQNRSSTLRGNPRKWRQN